MRLNKLISLAVMSYFLLNLSAQLLGLFEIAMLTKYGAVSLFSFLKKNPLLILGDLSRKA